MHVPIENLTFFQVSSIHMLFKPINKALNKRLVKHSSNGEDLFLLHVGIFKSNIFFLSIKRQFNDQMERTARNENADKNSVPAAN